MAVGCPVVCYIMSCFTEVVDPRHSSYALHFVRSTFICRMRFPNVATEFLLHYSQIWGSGMLIFFAVFRIVDIIVTARSRMIEDEPRGNRRMMRALMAMLEKPKILKIVSLGVMGLTMAMLSIALTIISAPEFATFYDDFQEWYDCIKYSFAKVALFGDTSWDTALVEGDGTICPSLRESGPSVVSMSLSLTAESLVPLLIAALFGSLGFGKHIRSLKTSLSLHRKKIKRGGVVVDPGSSTSNPDNVSGRTIKGGDSLPKGENSPPKEEENNGKLKPSTTDDLGPMRKVFKMPSIDRNPESLNDNYTISGLGGPKKISQMEDSKQMSQVNSPSLPKKEDTNLSEESRGAVVVLCVDNEEVSTDQSAAVGPPARPKGGLAKEIGEERNDKIRSLVSRKTRL